MTPKYIRLTSCPTCLRAGRAEKGHGDCFPGADTAALGADKKVFPETGRLDARSEASGAGAWTYEWEWAPRSSWGPSPCPADPLCQGCPACG